MTRVHVICEGQTEETFVNEVLQPALSPAGVYLFPALLGRPGHKGGNVGFERALRDIRLRLLGDVEAHCTTFFDYYGINPAFPGRSEAQSHWPAEQKARLLCESFAARVHERLGDGAASRFIPYVQMYEFEGLLFSCPRRFSIGIGEPDLETSFTQVRQSFTTPEHINDSIHTAPSKRVSELCSAYQKPVHGVLAALEIGVDDFRLQCPIFDRWLAEIEALGQAV